MNPRLLLAPILWVILLVSCTDSKPVIPHPNVIIVMTDDQGWGDLSSHNNPYLETPNIDHFKTESTSLERFFVSPVCAPTRASLLSGKWAMSTGAWGVTNRDEVMSSETITIAELFKDAGYTTGIFGKWHNGAQYPENPKGQGFEEFLGFTAGHWNNYFDTTLKNSNDQPVKTKGYISDVFTDAAIDFIKKNKEKPFLCYVPYNAPHSPFQVPDRYFDKYKAKGVNDKDACVYGMCENIDDNFGKILDVLEEENLNKNTIVIFMSDNGPNGIRYNDTMKGIKATNDEGGTRVPFFIRWPEKISSGKKIKNIAAHIDILPTLSNLCGIKIKDGTSIDGSDISSQLLGSNAPVKDRYIFSHWSGLTWNKVPGSVRNNKFRLVLKKEDTTLYNMIKDPYQSRDIFDSLPQTAHTMLNAYEQWIKKVYPKGIDRVPISIGYKEARETLIEAHEFNLGDGLRYHGTQGWANDWITQWDSKEDTILFDIKVNQTGNYAFEILYNCEESQLGSEIAIQIQKKEIKKKIDIAFSGEAIPSPDRIKRKEVYERTWGVLHVGNVNLEKGKHTFKIYATSVAKDSVMNLKAIKIKYN